MIKKKKHDEIVSLGKTKLNSTEALTFEGFNRFKYYSW